MPDRSKVISHRCDFIKGSRYFIRYTDYYGASGFRWILFRVTLDTEHMREYTERRLSIVYFCPFCGKKLVGKENGDV